MSATTKNLATAPHDMPSLGAEVSVVTGSRRARVLEALQDRSAPPQSSRQLAQRMGSHSAATTFWREVLNPLHQAGYVDQVEYGGAGDCWCITRKGLALCAELGLLQPTPRNLPNVAQPLVTIGDGPLPPGEYRCPRPGAYDYLRHPSRHGNRRHHRDGRMELVND